MEISEVIFINGVTLLAVINPPLQIPISGAMLNASKGNRKKCIIRAIITAFIILTLFAFLGNLLLSFIGISINSFSIAGGALLFIIGVQIMSGGNPSFDKKSNMSFNKGSCAVPIGTPFIAGPGAITVTTLMVQHDPLKVYFFPAVTVISIMICLIVTAIVLYYSDKLLALITEEGSNVLARIMGIVIASIGVEFIANGIMGFINIYSSS